MINSSLFSIQNEEITESTAISENIEIINDTIREIEKNPVEFFNNLIGFVKTYMDSNPSLKYSSTFIIWLITTVFIPVILMNLSSTPNDIILEINQVQNIKITNNYSVESVICTMNATDAVLRNHPRDKSKSMYKLFKDDEVRVLKDSLKWVFVIKENSLESGWVRKEYLNLNK